MEKEVKGSKDGRMERWEDEGWRDGGMGGWKNRWRDEKMKDGEMEG